MCLDTDSVVGLLPVEVRSSSHVMACVERPDVQGTVILVSDVVPASEMVASGLPVEVAIASEEQRRTSTASFTLWQPSLEVLWKWYE